MSPLGGVIVEGRESGVGYHRSSHHGWDFSGGATGCTPFKVYGFGFALLGPRNYESDLLSFVAVQLLDFSGFFCHLYWFLRRIYMSVWFGSWKVLEAKLVVICVGLWGLEDLCLDGLFCVLWVLLGGVLRYERLPFASQSVWLELVRHGANMSQTPVWLTLLRFESLVHPRHRSTFVLHYKFIDAKQMHVTIILIKPFALNFLSFQLS